MRGWLAVILMCVMIPCAFGQTPPSDYQPGTIMTVTAHPTTGQQGTDVPKYDVAVRIGNTSYLVLFTPPNGSNSVKALVGSELLVLVGSNTLTFNSPLTGKTEVPILSRETHPAQSPNWSQICGHYFPEKLQHLSEVLALTKDQQAKIRPTLEQETGEVGQICSNPALTAQDKLDRYEKVLRASDEKIKPHLSASQWQKLQDLRKEQKEDFKGIIPKQQSSNQMLRCLA